MSIEVRFDSAPLSALTFLPTMCLLSRDVGRSSVGVCMLPADHGDSHVLTMVYEGQRNVWMEGALPRWSGA